MANEKQTKPKVETGVSPKGTAVWPKLVVPDEYEGKKSFVTGLVILNAEEAEAFREKIDAAAQHQYDITKEELEEKLESAKGKDIPKLKKALEDLKLHVPYAPVYDDDGEETGEYQFNFKTAAEYKDKKTEKMVAKVLPFFDAKGKPMQVPKSVWGGSTLRVSFAYNPFYVASTGLCGVSLLINAIKVIDLVQGRGGSAASYGFGEEEEGYSAEDDINADESAEGGGSPEEDEDF